MFSVILGHTLGGVGEVYSSAVILQSQPTGLNPLGIKYTNYTNTSKISPLIWWETTPTISFDIIHVLKP